MTARIIDGKAIAAELRGKVASEVARVKREYDLQPGLAVVLIGNDPASEVYVRTKTKQTVEAGMASFEHKLPADTSEADVLALIAKLNRDPAVHGILVQLPLPQRPGCQPHRQRHRSFEGCRWLASAERGPSCQRSSGADAMHAARQRYAGEDRSPFARRDECAHHRSLQSCRTALVQLLLNENATVTIAHSRTRDLPALCRQADLVFRGCRPPEMVKGDWLKPGRDRDGCRHQSYHWRGRKEQACRRCRL